MQGFGHEGKERPGAGHGSYGQRVHRRQANAYRASYGTRILGAEHHPMMMTDDRMDRKILDTLSIRIEGLYPIFLSHLSSVITYDDRSYL